MQIQDTPLHCRKCKNEWIGEMIVNAPVKVALAAIKAVHCPQCGAGARFVAFGRGDVPDPTPVQSEEMTNLERRAAWLKLHDSGLSSCCIADQMCGIVPSGNHPHDGDDFGRCERLLILYPAWRARFNEMAGISPYWAALVAGWDEIVVAWRHDTELWRTKGKRSQDSEWKCYPLMRSILGSAAARAA